MDSIKTLKKITIAWWNTSLSPYSKHDTSSEEHKNYVFQTLLRLISERNTDVLCLCELSPADINILTFIFVNSEFSIYNGTVKEGQKTFDICVIYRTSIITFLNSRVISKHQPSRVIYAGQEVNFLINETLEPLTLFIVHWSSRLYDYEDSPNKAQLGSLLRDAITDCSESRGIKNIIVVGDFNEEPFNKSLTDHLFASRDIALVIKSPKLLYNPFWRHMVYTNLHPKVDKYISHGGTYYHKNNKLSKWKTFDQMIFSSDFVRGESWYLNESKVEIFSDEDFITHITNAKSKFDHLPIISVIERH